MQGLTSAATLIIKYTTLIMKKKKKKLMSFSAKELQSLAAESSGLCTFILFQTKTPTTCNHANTWLTNSCTYPGSVNQICIVFVQERKKKQQTKILLAKRKLSSSKVNISLHGQVNQVSRTANVNASSVGPLKDGVADTLVGVRGSGRVDSREWRSNSERFFSSHTPDCARKVHAG